MTNEDPVPTDSLPISDLPPQQDNQAKSFRAMFVGPNGIRAGWRFLMYVALFVGLAFLLQQVLNRIPVVSGILRSGQQGNTLSPPFEYIFEAMSITASFTAAFVMMRIEKRPFGAYGIPLQGAFGKRFWQGAVWGLAFQSLEMVFISAFGGFSLGTLALSGSAILKYATLWAIGFILVGISEEFTFRGYSLFTLATGIGFWPSAILLSVLFGAVHLGNQGEGWMGACEVAVFGLFACFTLRRTGNLWFAIGFHAATDYAETFIYSTPDSGLLATGHLLNSSFHGSKWLTGGTIGPEGSVMILVCYALIFPIFAWMYPAKKTSLPT